MNILVNKNKLIASPGNFANKSKIAGVLIIIPVFMIMVKGAIKMIDWLGRRYIHHSDI